jgi:hypothetical protein
VNVRRVQTSVKRIAAWFQSSTRFRIEKWAWIVFTPVALVTGLVNMVAVVSLLSIYALVISAASAEQAAEAKEAEEEE